MLVAATALVALEVNILINEVDANTAGSPDTLEFIELHDNPNVTLEGVVIVVFDGATDTVVQAHGLDGHHVNANGLFVLGGPGVPGADFPLPPDALPDAGAVGIYFGDAADYPPGSPVTTSGLWKAMVYGPYDPGLAVLTWDGVTPMTEGALGNPEGHSIQRWPHAWDGHDPMFYALGLPTPGRPNEVVHHAEPFCRGSANSVHPDGARLFYLGSGSVVDKGAAIHVDRVPNQLGYLVAGNDLGLPAPMGDGQLCIKWPIAMAPVVAENNMLRYPLDLEAMQLSAVGEILWFQYVYRDTQGQHLNVSEGLRVVFVP